MPSNECSIKKHSNGGLSVMTTERGETPQKCQRCRGGRFGPGITQVPAMWMPRFISAKANASPPVSRNRMIFC